MHADSQPHVDPVGPGGGVHRPLDRQRGLERRRGAFEDREDVVPTGGRLATAGRPHRGAHEAADIGKQGGVSIVKAAEQLGRAFEVGQQERDVAFGQLALRLQLRADETDGHMPCFIAALSRRLRARSRALSSSNTTWLNRARAFRTCAASLIGRRRRPRESMYAKALSGSCARSFALSGAILTSLDLRRGDVLSLWRSAPGAISVLRRVWNARVGGEASHERRKVVTVIFADVVGSTALGERVDPGDAALGDAAVVRAHGRRDRASWRHGRELHRRRSDGGLRDPGRA